MTTWPPCGASDADCLCGERADVDRPCTPVVETKSPLSIACPTCNAPIGERCTSIGVTHGRRRRAVSSPECKAAEEREASARLALRRAACAYSDVAGDNDESTFSAAWERLREAALSYATATHEATRARANESK